MVQISEHAGHLIKKMTARHGIPHGGLRIGIKAGGCSGFSYTFAWEASPRDGDFVFEGTDGAKVFIDVNGNGVADAGEPAVTTDATGKFTLTAASTVTGQFVADIPTSATNTASGAAVPAHLILRASAAQVTAQGNSAIVISPLSTEVQRAVEANSSTYATETANVAARLTGPAFNKGTATVAAADVVADLNGVSDAAEKYALAYESNSLANRFTYATAKLDRGDMYPDALAVAGGDPRLKGVAGITAGETIPATDPRAKITNKMNHIKKGKFYGHQAGLRWLPESCP